MHIYFALNVTLEVIRGCFTPPLQDCNTSKHNQGRQAAYRQACCEGPLLFVGLCRNLLCRLRSEKSRLDIKIEEVLKKNPLATFHTSWCYLFILCCYTSLQRKKKIHLSPSTHLEQTLFFLFFFSSHPLLLLLFCRSLSRCLWFLITP